jgi:Cu+-exporting ATPase
VAIRPADGATEADLLHAAATAESSSEHPLAKAVLRKAEEHGVQPGKPDRFVYAPGRGIVCSFGTTEIVVGNEGLLRDRGIAMSGEACSIRVSVDGKYVGGLDVADVTRPGAAESIGELKAMGLDIVMMTGDSRDVALKIAREVGIGNVLADLLPEQKMLEVERLQAAGKRVAMVGDGINDAPALARADVGIGMGSGTEVAREAADVVLLGNDLLKLVETMKVARRCRRIIMQNFIGTIAVDGVGVVLAAFNVLNPLLAAFIHVTSELAFILNSTRLLPRRESGPRVVSARHERAAHVFGGHT